MHSRTPRSRNVLVESRSTTAIHVVDSRSKDVVFNVDTLKKTTSVSNALCVQSLHGPTATIRSENLDKDVDIFLPSSGVVDLAQIPSLYVSPVHVWKRSSGETWTAAEFPGPLCEWTAIGFDQPVCCLDIKVETPGTEKIEVFARGEITSSASPFISIVNGERSDESFSRTENVLLHVGGNILPSKLNGVFMKTWILLHVVNGSGTTISEIAGVRNGLFNAPGRDPVFVGKRKREHMPVEIFCNSGVSNLAKHGEMWIYTNNVLLSENHIVCIVSTCTKHINLAYPVILNFQYTCPEDTVLQITSNASLGSIPEIYLSASPGLSFKEVSILLNPHTQFGTRLLFNIKLGAGSSICLFGTFIECISFL